MTDCGGAAGSGVVVGSRGRSGEKSSMAVAAASVVWCHCRCEG